MTARLLPVALILGCATPEPPPAGGLHGVPLPAATPRPAFSLQTTDGRPFDFGLATKGRLTLLFFGYMNCPDVCPATMANLGAVLGRLTSSERGLIDVVFVTTDPVRDSAAALGRWLARFEPGIIGLTGTEEQVARAQQAAGVSLAIRGPGEGYTVSHAAQVLVYSPDDSGHVVYPFGTRQAEWADDLPVLLNRWVVFDE